tara:strand:+ start:14496 stop:15368 length:873 start_codon:yes stop_codon:yes gene_type:complete
MSSRNNQDRFGGPLSPDTDTPPPEVYQQQEEASPTMSYVAPTELVELPSKGKFYPQGHPLHGQESIEIRHMTAKDEDILVNQSYLKKGIAIDKLLENVIVNKAIKTDDLLIGDKNALVVATRVTGYGSEYITKVACPSCGSTSDNEFDLEEAKVINNPDLASYDAEQTENGTFLITLPRTGAVVEVKPQTGADEKKIVSQSEVRKKHRLPPLGLTDQIKGYVLSVTHNGNPVTVSEFVDNMPALDSKFLRTTYKNIMPNVELVQHYECSSCGFEQALEVPFTTDFFWPKQ